MTDNMDICSVLVTSCDAYSDAWYPFFSLFNIQWKECPYKVYLNTETMECKYSVNRGKVIVLHPNCLRDKSGKEISWSERLSQSLSKIESKYVICMLEDFFLKAPVDNGKVEQCVQYMEEHENTGFFKFYPDPCLPNTVLDDFSEVDSSFIFCISAMVTLWRKDYLISILRKEDPWDFEFFASARLRNSIRKGVSMYVNYVQKKGNPIFDYMFTSTSGGAWSGILRGKWLISVPTLFDKYGITIDYNKRGFIDPTFIPQTIHTHGGVRKICFDLLKNPTRLFHYAQCLKNIIELKYKKIKSIYFNN